jgi:hypothetical protein
MPQRILEPEPKEVRNGNGARSSGSPTTPSPPSSTTSPGNTGSVDLTFEPGARSGGSPSVATIVATGVSFAFNPLGTVALGLLGSATKKPRPFLGQPIAVIDGQVIFNPEKLPGPTGRGVSVFANDEKLNREKLQRTLDTGVVQPGISNYYSGLAAALVQLHDAARTGSPDVRTPKINPPGHDEDISSRPGPGGESFGPVGFPFGSQQLSPIGEEDFFVPRFVRSIPGGAAGFSQQTPAGQRQMLGGGGAATGRRPRRRKAAKSSGGKRRRRTGSRRSSRKPRPGTKAWMKYIRGLRK